jgi:hypothetical protein
MQLRGQICPNGTQPGPAGRTAYVRAQSNVGRHDQADVAINAVHVEQIDGHRLHRLWGAATLFACLMVPAWSVLEGRCEIRGATTT